MNGAGDEACAYCGVAHDPLKPCAGPCSTHRTCPVHTTGVRCVVCPRLFTCPTCRARPGERCRRPSGHRGGFVGNHRRRLRLADAEALRRYPDEIANELERDRQRGGEEAMKAWVRNLNDLARNMDTWGSRVDPALIDRYIQLAQAGPDSVELPSPTGKTEA
jgi:hypothetical protein